MRHARSDLALAKASPPPGTLLEALCFHAQQAAEKALKSVLVSRSVPVPRTHSIGALLDLVAQHASVSSHLRQAAALTEYAVTTRYPGDFEPVGAEEHSAAVRLAEGVVSWAETILGRQ